MTTNLGLRGYSLFPYYAALFDWQGVKKKDTSEICSLKQVMIIGMVIQSSRQGKRTIKGNLKVKLFLNLKKKCHFLG